MKYGIQPMLPSESAIFSPGMRSKQSENSHASIVPAARTAPKVRFASPGASDEITGIVDDDPTCMETTSSRSCAAASTGSQYRLGSWIVGSPSGSGFSENATDVAPFDAQRS